MAQKQYNQQKRQTNKEKQLSYLHSKKKEVSKQSPKSKSTTNTAGSKKKTNPVKSAKTTIKRSNATRKSLLERIFQKDDAPATVQETIHFDEMYPDGICKVEDGYYTKTITFGDINYQLAQKDIKFNLFEKWCDVLNLFDDSLTLQLTFLNEKQDISEFEKLFDITPQNDSLDIYRHEYSTMLKNQYAKGNNGLVKSKYLTFGVQAENFKFARQRIASVEKSLFNLFIQLGVKASPLNGEERLKVLHRQMHPNPKEKFYYNRRQKKRKAVKQKYIDKDCISPSSLDFREKNTFKMGDYYTECSWVLMLANDIDDEVISKLYDLDCEFAINIHIKPVNQAEAIKMVKRILSDVDKSKIDEQMKAVRAGYDMDIMSPNLKRSEVEVKEMLEALETRDERMFNITFTLMNTAKTKQALKLNIDAMKSILSQKYNCHIKPLDFMQEKGLISNLVLGLDQLKMERALLTTSTAIFVPFTTAELSQEDREAIYYGLNSLSNNMILANRKVLKNPNGLILGIPGSGKTFAAKREIVNVILITNDDVIMIDPEDEYSALVKALGGVVINISPNSQNYINPMDIHMNYGDGEDPISKKSGFILSFCELIMTNPKTNSGGISPEGRSALDECVREIYTKYFENPDENEMPILEDLYNALLEKHDKFATRIANSLKLYVHGSHNVFNHRTNIDINSRLVCFNTKELGNTIKTLGMLIMQDQIWSRVSKNRNTDKYTWFYCDEVHLLLQSLDTATYFCDIWKRFRKWGGIPTGITQNVTDFMATPQVENILSNSDFVLMLSQSQNDQDILQQKLNISDEQLSRVTQSNAGEGLIFFGDTIIAFTDNFPKNTELYQLMTSKPKEMIVR